VGHSTRDRQFVDQQSHNIPVNSMLEAQRPDWIFVVFISMNFSNPWLVDISGLGNWTGHTQGSRQHIHSLVGDIGELHKRASLVASFLPHSRVLPRFRVTPPCCAILGLVTLLAYIDHPFGSTRQATQVQIDRSRRLVYLSAFEATVSPNCVVSFAMVRFG